MPEGHSGKAEKLLPGLTRGNQVIDNDDGLAGLDSVGLHLERVLYDNVMRLDGRYPED